MLEWKKVNYMKPVRVAMVIAMVWLSLVLFEQTTCSASERPTSGSGEAQQAAVIPTGTPRYSITIVKAYPHDPEAFTQGLLFADGFLYESTGTHHRNSSLRKVDLETGTVLKVQTLSQEYFGEGLTLWQKKLIQLTWRSGIGFVYDLDSFLRVGEFRYNTEGWGLTHDGKSLIMSDGSGVLRFLNPESYAEVARIEVRDQGVPIRNLNELEYVKGEIFANVWRMDMIVRISSETGKVLGWIDLSALRSALGPARNAEVLNGIAYDSARDRIFVTGKLWPKVFEIKLVPP
jgi:glutaminyl-peptide cyclotransferase